MASLSLAHGGSLLLASLAFGACADDAANTPDSGPNGDGGPSALVDAGSASRDSEASDHDAATPLDAGMPRDGSVSSDDGDAGDGAARDDGGAQPPASACTGKPGAKRGKVAGTVMVGSDKRSFVYYAPASLDANQAVPLIISPHGFSMTGDDMFALTGYKELADREGAVAFFPNGKEPFPWNVGRNVTGLGASFGSTADDQGFVDAMIQFAVDDQCIDKAHMFVSGFSMGGYFSNENSCLRSDIAGIGPSAGGSHDLTACKGSIKPVIIFHGDADTLITYADNAIVTRDRWVMRNGCTKEAPEKKKVKGGECEYYQGCQAKGQVVLCTFAGMGHVWAGGVPGSNAFVDSSRESAAELAWAFWKQYAW